MSPITIAFYAKESEPAATVIELPGWGAISRSLAEPSGEMLGLDLKDPERHTCEYRNSQKDCIHKDGIAWSPVTLSEPYRLDQNVISVNLAVFDLDHVSVEALDQTLDKLKSEGITFVCHSTHGHKPPHDCAARIICPISRPVTPKEWARIFTNAQKTLVKTADPHCRNVSRFYFMPRIPIGAPYFFREYNGLPLNVDKLLAVNIPSTTPTALAVNAPVDDEPITASLGDLRSDVVGLRRSKKDSDPVAYVLLDRVLKGRYLALPGDSEFIDADNVPKGRDAAVNKVAAMLAFTFDPETPTDAVVELLRPCIVTMQCEPEGADHWLQKARDSYSRALARRVDRDNERAAANAKLRLEIDRIIKARGTRVVHDKPAADEPGESDEEIFLALEKGPKTGRPLISRVNIESVLERAGASKYNIRWNEYAKRIDVVGGMFADLKPGQVPLEIASWLERVFQIPAPTPVVKETIALTAYRHSYNPLTEYLRGLSWDGTPRLDRILVDYMTTRREGPEGADLTPLLKTFGRKWAISAIARALKPGCQVDHILVLEGPEGYKKTSFFRALGGPFFAATSVKMGDKDSKMAASSAWIIELAEMAGLRKSDNADLKAFITTTEDFYRRPYEPVYETCPRTSVFVGTVNPNDFALPSADENRRYWCVYVEAPVDTRQLEADRDQIWAEAVAAYIAGHEADGKPEDYLWWLSPEEEALARKLAGEKVPDSPLRERLHEWWNRMPVDSRPREFTADELIVKLMLSHNDDPKKMRALLTEIGMGLKQLGFTSKRERRKGMPGMVTLYRPTPAHLEPVEIATAPIMGVSATVHNIAERRKAAT